MHTKCGLFEGIGAGDWGFLSDIGAGEKHIIMCYSQKKICEVRQLNQTPRAHFAGDSDLTPVAEFSGELDGVLRIF